MMIVEARLIPFSFSLDKILFGPGEAEQKNKKGMKAERESVLCTSQAVNDEEEEEQGKLMEKTKYERRKKRRK